MKVTDALSHLEHLVDECAPTQTDYDHYMQDLAVLRGITPTDLERAYADATEANLATLAGLAMRKSSSIREVERQMSICLTMLGVCNGLRPDAYERLPRIKEMLAAGGGRYPTLGTALTSWVASMRKIA